MVDSKLPLISIVFEDADLLVVDKPSGVLSCPGKSQDNSVLTRVLHSEHGVCGPALVHRLDMDTSGLLLIAKSRDCHRHLQQQFEKRKVRKRYKARLASPVEALGGRIHLPIRLDIDNRPTQIVCLRFGKESTTLWHRCDISNPFDIALYPLTGRTHQLRVHTSATQGLGIAVAGDRLYGAKTNTLDGQCYSELQPHLQPHLGQQKIHSNRLMLHADFLQFMHPLTGQMMSITCPSPF